jgi:taurine dioxygenase
MSELVTKTSELEIRRLSPHLGADVLNLDLGQVIDRADADRIMALRRALDEHLVLRLRGQRLTPQQMERFGSFLGPFLSLKRPEAPETEHHPGLKFVKIISNAQTADGRPLGDGSSAAQDWHTDGASKPRPATFSHFYARTVPAVDPPKTYWKNMYLVYDTLPTALKHEIRGLTVIHHHYSAGNEYPLPPTLPLERRLAGPRHPLVRIHPATNRPVLYLPHRDDCIVFGMSESESYELVTRLRQFATAAPFWWSAVLEADDFVIWDNRPCLHRRDSWDPSSDRTIWHLTNEGEVPIPGGVEEPARQQGDSSFPRSDFRHT